MGLADLFGLHDANGPWYLWWSGIGGDLLTAIPLLFAMVIWYRHHKCRYCYRMGHAVPHQHYPVCYKHKNS